MFKVPEWGSKTNPKKGEKTKSTKSHYSNKSKKPKPKQNGKLKLKHKLQHIQDKQKNKIKKVIEPDADTEVTKMQVRSRKKALTHQTLFLGANKRHKKQKNIVDNSDKKPAYSFNLTKSKKELTLREKMLERLKASRFRYLNEQMYTSVGKDAKRYFDKDQNAYIAYHEGYRQQVAKWPLNPIDVIIQKVKKLPQDFIIADFGCGEAKLAQSTTHTVHCFDLVAVDERVTACDMAHVTLKDNSVNVVVFCLSLMGINLKDYILEARRVLKNKGLLLIAEVESRFEDVDVFIKNMRAYGFSNTAKDFSRNLFFFLDFVKQNAKNDTNLPNINLKPCLYKKR